MTTSQDLLEATVTALSAPGATECKGGVYQPGDWPTQDDQYPRLKARLLGENKISLGRNGIAFTVVANIRLLIEVSQGAKPDGSGATNAERQVWRIVRQCEVALINSYPLTSLLQQFPSITSQLTYTSEQQTHLAGAQIDVGMEFYQGVDDFAPIAAGEVDQVGVTLPAYPSLDGSFPLD